MHNSQSVFDNLVLPRNTAKPNAETIGSVIDTAILQCTALAESLVISSYKVRDMQPVADTVYASLQLLRSAQDDFVRVVSQPNYNDADIEL